ncbi:hypothetical protein SSS_08941 [Sarcoptes scabiei]|uniref:AIMP2 thioredoxin-like domain-containing protein n=1 Tax=Sarcoptes scabiei TaxID=52283 RepID=A0A834RG32_SARSC|nr:hypothetical protein SSS_08941 [Sarcoptes scabiei]UXI15354.1 loss of heterozygosity 12 chromosomal region 1 protein [Sarcoptes scabiei]
MLMYSLPNIYSQYPIDLNRIPSIMYAMDPYYESGMNSIDNHEKVQSESQIDLKPIELNDVNDESLTPLLNDFLSRQMLLISRLNDLERTLLKSSLSQNSSNEFQVVGLRSIIEKHEDIVIQYDHTRPPSILFAMLKVLSKRISRKILINHHFHSSLSNLSVSEKKKVLDQSISFGLEFSSSESKTERNQHELIFTFIARKMHGISCCYKSNQPLIDNELKLIKKIWPLVCEDDAELEELWRVLIDSDLTSDKVCVESLGRFLINLDQKRFLMGRSNPNLLDVIIWSLANFSLHNVRTLKSLTDPWWSKSIESIVLNS